MNFKKGQWGNGQPSIEIEGFSYSRKSFLQVLTFVCRHYGLALPEVTEDPDELIAVVSVQGHRAFFHMDRHAFSIALMSDSGRDELFAALARFPTLVTR